MVILDVSKELNLKNPNYRKAAELYVWQSYLSDIGNGDITTDLFLSKKNQIVKAKILAKESGVLAGMTEAEWFLKRLGIKILSSKKDGWKLKKGDCILFLSGRADKILACERTLLNLLQRMSGIATATHQMATKIPRSVKLLATRKTFWGELDKRAVSVGGGCTHRLNLSDAILIKDNHIALSYDLKKSLKKVFDYSKKIRFIEIELESINQAEYFVEIYNKIKPKDKIIVMLDNFKLADIKKAVAILKKTGVLIEVSGGINGKNIGKYAIKGINFISSGAITNKAKALDFSLNIRAKD